MFLHITASIVNKGILEGEENWRIDYNARRPHSSLGNLTPQEYADVIGFTKLKTGT